MKKTTICITVVLMVLMLTGCGAQVTIPEPPTSSSVPSVTDATFVITITGMTKDKELKRATGSDTVKFTGNYLTITAGGKSTSQSVEGTVPATYTTTGTMVSCAFQNMLEYGWLDVTITKNGAWAAQSTTSAAYGMVTASTY